MNVSTNQLTPAEQAVAEIIWREYDGDDYDPEDGGHEASLREHAEAARAVVAAVRPEIYDEIATEVEQSPMFVDQHQRAVIAHLFRHVAAGMRMPVRLSRPTAEETQ